MGDPGGFPAGEGSRWGSKAMRQSVLCGQFFRSSAEMGKRDKVWLKGTQDFGQVYVL